MLEGIIQDKPKWCNFLFNTNLLLIYLTVLAFKSKPVLLSNLLHLINIDSNFSPLHYVYIKINTSETMQKTLIIKVLVIYLFQWYMKYAPQWSGKETTNFFLLYWLTSKFFYHDDKFLFIWRSIHVRIIFLIRWSINIEFPFLYQCRMIDII